MTKKCSICDHDKLKQIGEHTDRRKGIEGRWLLFSCYYCRVISIQPSPTVEDLSSYYSVYSKHHNVNIVLQSGSRHPWIRKLYHTFSGDVDPRDFIEPDQHAVLLDYGCGTGGCLYDFQERGIKIFGAEISDKLVSACQKKGLDVHQVVSPDHIPFANKKFDIVYLMQVFEHIRKPHLFMDELFRILKPNGEMYIAVPNSNSQWRKIFGKHWVSGWFAPFHLFHYNVESLSNLAEQHGFVVSYSWTKTPESWFRLNLKAWIYQKENQLDVRQTFLDLKAMRYLLTALLRFLEVFIRERDCLVIKFLKKDC